MTTTYQTGDRRGRIVVSTNIPISGAGAHGYIQNWLDGQKTANATNAFFPDAVADNTGLWILFDLDSPSVWDEATSYEALVGSGYPSRGNWKWQGWDGSAWNDIGGAFALGGVATQIHSTLNGNITPYYRYQLLGMGGAISNSGWMLEIEAREDIQEIDIVNPTIRFRKSYYPIEVVTQIPAILYTTTPPPYQLVARSRTFKDCLPADFFEAEVTQEFTWNFGTTLPVCEVACVLMLRREGDTSPVTLADIGPIDAGPLTDPRCISENHGTNVTTPVHHVPVPWIGSRLCKETGDFYIGLFAYASMGTHPVPSGQYIWPTDGTFRAKSYRGN